MGRRIPENPTVRILILGAPGVGKDCLESRFTTMQYPPQYDTNLVNSRRFLHLSPRRPTPAGSPSPSTADQQQQQTPKPRPSSTSSTFSNPGTLPTTPTIPQTQSQPQTQTQPQGHQPKLTLNTTLPPADNNNNDWFHPPTPSPTPTTPRDPNTSSSSTSYLIEIQNYPLLQHRGARAALLARGRFDAVLLVYDVCSRASFDAAAGLYDEVPLRRSRVRGGGEGRSPAGSSGLGPVPSPGGGGDGVGETVIALVGNKSDVDADANAGGEFFGGHEALSVEEAEREGREVEARGLVHPLFRGRFGGPPAGDRSPVKKPGAAARPVLNLRVNVSNDDNEERPLPPTPPEPTSAIDKWIAMDAEDTDDEQTRVGSRESFKTATTAAPARREVSRFEGELLARSLLLNVPFFETSAKTGDNVDEMFEAVVREALWQMGHKVEEGQGKTAREGEGALGKKGSVLKKGRRSFVEGGVVSSPISALPPVLKLPDFERDGFNGAKGPDIMLREMVTVENPVPAAAPVALKRRRDSVLGGFFKKIFRRSAVTG
ncbi:P-loop containing nucleoside triphosphate hydrolase protein [Podospora conica]|nr:P-loop containing nucleoside triphosphate hydrolase protein [Schizothecium conicum]